VSIKRAAKAGSRTDFEPVGVIDIGSNSVRLVVYEAAVRAPTPFFNEKVLCGLGRPVAAKGRIGSEASERAFAALRRFRAITDRLGVKTLRAIATAAVRDAADGSQFVKECERLTGVGIDILSGEREARLAASGIMLGFQDPNGIAGDLGGGSLELTDIAGKTMRQATTLPLGGLRLLEKSGGKIDKARAIVERHFDSVSWLGSDKNRTFYAVGGTWRAFAKLHMAQTDYPLRVVHGYAIATSEAQALAARIIKANGSKPIPGIEEVSKARREVLPLGAVVLESLLPRLQPREFVASIHGVREGLLLEMMPENERRRDPLLSFCEDYARLRSRSYEHARELCDWTDLLFTKPCLKETADERRLRHAACLISDIGWRAHPDYRGEQSLNVIAHAALSGIDHPGRLFLSMSVYFRHAGQGADAGQHLSERLKSAVSRRDQKRARIIGAAVRAAHMLSAGMPGIVPHTPLSYEENVLVLDIPARYASIDGERLRRRFSTLAQLVSREAIVRVQT